MTKKSVKQELKIESDLRLTRRGKYLADYTWEEAEEYLMFHKGLLIPAGICEQHSKHMPLNTDTIVSEWFADYLSSETGMLVAPSLNYGVGLPCDRYYTGSSSISYRDLKNTMSSLVSRWKTQGFQHFYVVSAHGDPFHLKAFGDTGHDNIFVLELYSYEFSSILNRQTMAKHAGEVETSVMMVLFPDKVRYDKIEDFEVPYEEFKPFLNHEKEEPIPNCPGCQGYPSAATSEKGEKIVKVIKEGSLQWLKQLIIDNEHPGRGYR